MTAERLVDDSRNNLERRNHLEVFFAERGRGRKEGIIGLFFLTQGSYLKCHVREGERRGEGTSFKEMNFVLIKFFALLKT